MVYKSHIIGQGVKMRADAGKHYKPIGEFKPFEPVKFMNKAYIDNLCWCRVKRANGQMVWVVDRYLHVRE